jgi:hypothetical protein
MTGQLLILPYDRKPRLYRAAVHPSLGRIRWVVGGFIEHVPLWDTIDGRPCIVYCNEEGKINNLPVNIIATDMWWRAARRNMNDVLCGHVICIIDLPEDTREEWKDQ